MSDPEYIFTTVHDFKTNFSRYIRTLRDGTAEGIMIHRYKRLVGIFFLPEQYQTTSNHPSAPKEKDDFLSGLTKEEEKAGNDKAMALFSQLLGTLGTE